MRILLIFLIFVMIVYGINLVYGELQQIDGNTPISSCGIIGGTVETILISDKYNQTVDICRYKNYNFRIAEPAHKLVNAIGTFTDPDTKEKFTFSSSSITPSFCGIGEISSPDDHRTRIMHLIYNNVQYEIKSIANTRLCNIEEFIPEEKKLVSLVAGNIGQIHEIKFIIPNEIMNGEFIVTVDGQSHAFDISNTATTTELSVILDFTDTIQKTIEITSTHAIPEFSNVGVIILVTLTSTILFSIFSKRIRLIYS